jgi:hypothetical protein
MCAFGGIQVERVGDGVEIRCSLPGRDGGQPLTKTFQFRRDGRLSVAYTWDATLGGERDVFAPELSLFRKLELRCEPQADMWVHPVETVAKSERGLDRTLQGESVTLRWPLAAGAARVEVSVPGQPQP